MAAKSQGPKGQNGALSSLNVAIDSLNRAKEASSIAPAKVAFSSASDLLILARVCFDPVHIGLSLANNVFRTR